MRFIQKLPPVAALNPISGLPTKELCTHDWAMRIATAFAVQEGKADVLDAIEFRSTFGAARELEWVAASDPIHAALAEQFKNPKAFGMGYLLSAEKHIRAVVDAPSKAPAIANGAVHIEG